MTQKEIWNERYSVGSKGFEKAELEWIKAYEKFFNEKKASVVVDLGCGRGCNSSYISEQGHNVTACDFSKEAIDYIKITYPQIDVKCFDMIHEFPNDIKNVDVVLASLSTHYFLLSDTKKLYDKIYSILNPKGYLIFRVNSKKEFDNRDKIHVKSVLEKDYYELNDGDKKRYFDINSVSELLINFNIIELEESNAIYYGKEKYFIEGVAQKT